MRDVPLIIWEDGERVVIGDAAVHDSFTREVALDEALENSTVFGVSLRAFRI